MADRDALEESRTHPHALAGVDDLDSGFTEVPEPDLSCDIGTQEWIAPCRRNPLRAAAHCVIHQRCQAGVNCVQKLTVLRIPSFRIADCRYQIPGLPRGGIAE
jgi:hypothetical protein